MPIDKRRIRERSESMKLHVSYACPDTNDRKLLPPR